MDIPHGGPSRPLFPDRIEIENVGFFVEGGKPKDQEKNPRTRRKTRVARTRANNKPNLIVTPGPGIEPGQQRWKTSAPT